MNFRTSSRSTDFFFCVQIFVFETQGVRRESISSFFLTGIATYVMMMSSEKVFLRGPDSIVARVKARRPVLCARAP
jgi:hypothetical protein